MKPVHIDIPEEQFNAVVDLIENMQDIGLNGKTSVHQLGAMLHINTNRMRYILDELVIAKRILKICIVDRGENYKRYKYEVPNE